MIAQAVGCNLTEKVDAVINVAGMQHLGMSCIPEKPISMVIYGAKNDTTVPPKDIIADDGYFYEPMHNTVTDWKNAFECKSNVAEEINSPMQITKVHFSDCQDNVTVTSLFDHSNDHDWPKPYKYGLNLLFDPLLNLSLIHI